MDVAKYESYLHTLQCDVPSELLNEATTDAIVSLGAGAGGGLRGRRCEKGAYL